MEFESDCTTKPSSAIAVLRTGLSRRNLIRRWGVAACAVPVAWLMDGCAGGTTSTPAAPTPWATGGTMRIGATARAINPFSSAGATTCRLACEATIGPCHTFSPERTDISDGWDGLPMHMRLRIVDAHCQPIEGAIVEVWHTNHAGGYSGRIVQMCNNNAQDLERQFFRGWQRTGKDGIVRFDSCYPGWYGGRANHVHLRVMKGAYDRSDEAPTWVTTQLLFADELNAGIFDREPLYKDKGQPDTTLAMDGVIGQEQDKAPYLFDVRNVDGVMLASKTLAIRSSLDEPLCSARGMPPPGGPGGPGGPGHPGPPMDAPHPAGAIRWPRT